MNRRLLRRLMVDRIQDYLEQHPQTTLAEAQAALADELEEEYGSSGWLTLLLSLLSALLPLLLELKQGKPVSK